MPIAVLNGQTQLLQLSICLGLPQEMLSDFLWKQIIINCFICIQLEQNKLYHAADIAGEMCYQQSSWTNLLKVAPNECIPKDNS